MNQSSPANKRAATPSLYVGDLAPEVAEANLLETFSAVGPVASVRVCRDSVTRRSLGYGYVNFIRMEDAERSLETLNYSKIGNRSCRLMWSHRDPALRKSGVGNICVKNLALTIDSKQLNDTFSIFGSIISCKVSINNESGASLGYGFVHYEDAESAQRAIEKVNGKNIAGSTVTVELYKSKADRGKGKESQFQNLYVKNLPEDITEEKLTEIFSEYGKVTSVYVKVHKLVKSKKAPTDTAAVVVEEGKDDDTADVLCSAYGFVNFETHEGAAKALDAFKDGQKKVGGNDIYVNVAKKKSEREQENLMKNQALKAERAKKFAGVNLYIKNFTEEMTDDKLREIFSEYGNINSTRVMTDDTGKSKGFGFVSFSTPDEATKAVTQSNGRVVDGKPLYVALHQDRRERRAALEQFHQHKMTSPMYGQQPVYNNMGQGNARMMYPPQWGNMMAARGPVNYQLMPMGGRNGQGPNRRPQNGQRQQVQDPSRFNRGKRISRPGMTQETQQPQQSQQQPQQATIDIKKLAKVTPEERTQMLGESLYPRVHALRPKLAGKITGMLLEMENTELLMLIDSQELLQQKVKEAVQVLEQHTE